MVLTMPLASAPARLLNKKTLRFSALAAVFVALAILGSGCHTSTTAPHAVSQVGDSKLILTPEADTATSGAFLALDAPDSSSVDKYTLTGNTQAGVSQAASSIQNGAMTFYDFPIRGTLPRDFFLNLSKPVVGTIFITNTISQTAAASGHGFESGKIRTVLKSGGQIVGGAEAEYNLVQSGYSTTAYTKPWAQVQVRFWPEVHTLKAGSDLVLSIGRNGGLADLFLGTGLQQQSFLELHYYESDPMAGALYLTGRTLITGVNEESEPSQEFFERAEAASGAPGQVVFLPPVEDAPEEDATAVIALFTLLPSLFLLAPMRRQLKKGTVALASLLLISLVLGGCLGSNNDGTSSSAGSSPRPTANQTVVDRPDLEGTGKGSVRGLVFDENKFAIAGAHVSFLATSVFTKTNKTGHFHFPDVTAGKYVLRVDATGFESYEYPTTVEAAKELNLKIPMVRPPIENNNDKEHRHGEWGEASILPWQELRNIMPTSCAYTCTDTPASSNSWYCAETEQKCRYELPIDIFKPVMPGSGLLEVKLTWTSPAGNTQLKEMGLTFASSLRSNEDLNEMLPRPSGTPFRIAFYPNDADPGHQKFTNWAVFLQVSKTDLYSPWSAHLRQISPVNVDITMHKLVVPFEPKHRDRWDGGNEIRILKDNTISSSSYCNPSSSTYTGLTSGAFVPPGTGSVSGTVKWVNPRDVPTVGVDYGLSYKPANVPTALALQYLVPIPVTKGAGNEFTFTFTPKAEEVDQFYQSSTNWRFYITDKNCVAGTTYGTSYRGGSVVFTLNGEAVRDPNWKDL
jgi:hypothetical protein